LCCRGITIKRAETLHDAPVYKPFLNIKTKMKMKRIITLSIVFATLVLGSKAQYIPKNAIKVNPASVLVSTGNVSFETAVTKNQSAQLGVFYSGMGLGDFKYEGFGITPEYRFYFGGEKQALNGGYVAPFARYQQFSISDKGTSSQGKFETIGGGVLLGWEKSYRSGFVLDLFAGPSYNKMNFKTGSENNFDINSGIRGFGLRAGVSLGFTF
jgi:hypothetical protein